VDIFFSNRKKLFKLSKMSRLCLPSDAAKRFNEVEDSLSDTTVSTFSWCVKYVSVEKLLTLRLRLEKRKSSTEHTTKNVH
jgi:hypothetical protein